MKEQKPKTKKNKKPNRIPDWNQKFCFFWFSLFFFFWFSWFLQVKIGFSSKTKIFLEFFFVFHQKTKFPLRFFGLSAKSQNFPLIFWCWKTGNGKTKKTQGKFWFLMKNQLLPAKIKKTKKTQRKQQKNKTFDFSQGICLVFCFFVFWVFGCIPPTLCF